MKRKSGIAKFNIFLSVVLVICIAAAAFVVSRPVKVETASNANNATSEDAVVIDAFVAGKYGGVDFATKDDVVNYYVEAYNYTKTLTADYITEDGSTAQYYKLLGTEDIQIGDVQIDGSTNSMINGVVPGIVGGLFQKGTYGLVPCNNRDPLLDNSNGDAANPGEFDFRKSYATPEDALEANVKDNGDGTITVVIQPKAAQMSLRGADSQGRFFEVLGDIGATVAQIEQVTFSQGTPEDNIKVTYKGGTVTAKIDTATKEIVEADYVMEVMVDVTHANLLVIKDKSASLPITYTNHFPADDQYLLDTKKITRK